MRGGRPPDPGGVRGADPESETDGELPTEEAGDRTAWRFIEPGSGNRGELHCDAHLRVFGNTAKGSGRGDRRMSEACW